MRWLAGEWTGFDAFAHQSYPFDRLVEETKRLPAEGKKGGGGD